MAEDVTLIIRVKDLSKKAFKELNSNLKKSEDVSKKAFKAASIGGAALAVGLGKLGYEAIQSAANFETMSVSLRTAFQGNEEQARAAQQQITDFASKTPFQLEEVLGGFIKLKNYGLDPSERALTAYGDTAAAMGKSLDQMVEAVADAASGEFERLKEFGIKSSKEGDKVKFTFRGVTTEVGNNSKEIEEYLMQLGETNFAGGMADQSKTLTGLISTLKDNFSIALAQMAQDSGLLEGAKQLVEKATEAIGEFSAKVQEAGGFIQYLGEGLSEHQGTITVFAGAVLGAFVPAIAAGAASLWAFAAGAVAAMVPLLPFIGIGAAIAAVVALLVNHFGGWQGVLERLQIFVDEKLKPAWESITNYWNGTVRPAIDNIWDAIQTYLLPAFREIWEFVKSNFIPIWERLQEAWRVLKEKMDEGGGTMLFVKFNLILLVGALAVFAAMVLGAITVVTAIIAALGVLIGVIFAAINAYEAFTAKVRTFVADALQWLLDKLNELINKAFHVDIQLPSVSEIRQEMSMIVGEIKSWLSSPFKAKATVETTRVNIGGASENHRGGHVSEFGTVQKYARGGVVPGVGNRDTVPALLTPGETVLPRGVSPTQVNLSISINNPVVDSQSRLYELVDMVKEAINRDSEIARLGQEVG